MVHRESWCDVKFELEMKAMEGHPHSRRAKEAYFDFAAPIVWE